MRADRISNICLTRRFSLFPGSRFRSEVVVRLSGDAVALVSDSFLTHDPAGGGDMFASYFSEIVVEDETSKRLSPSTD